MFYPTPVAVGAGEKHVSNPIRKCFTAFYVYVCAFRCHTENGCDELCITNEGGTIAHKFSGESGHFKNVVIPGSILKWTFKSDSSTNYWGYKFAVSACTDAKVQVSDADATAKPSVMLCRHAITMLSASWPQDSDLCFSLACALCTFAMDMRAGMGDRVWAINTITSLMNANLCPLPNVEALTGHLQVKPEVPSFQVGADVVFVRACEPFAPGDVAQIVEAKGAVPAGGATRDEGAAKRQYRIVDKEGRSCNMPPFIPGEAPVYFTIPDNARFLALGAGNNRVNGFWATDPAETRNEHPVFRKVDNAGAFLPAEQECTMFYGSQWNMAIGNLSRPPAYEQTEDTPEPASKIEMITSPPFFKWYQTSRFEMCCAPKHHIVLGATHVSNPAYCF